MSKTWKDDPYSDYDSARNGRNRRKAEKKALKQRRRLAIDAERKTYAEEPIEEHAS